MTTKTGNKSATLLRAEAFIEGIEADWTKDGRVTDEEAAKAKKAATRRLKDLLDRTTKEAFSVL